MVSFSLLVTRKRPQIPLFLLLHLALIGVEAYEVINGGEGRRVLWASRLLLPSQRP